jgi:hypothetical protein
MGMSIRGRLTVLTQKPFTPESLAAAVRGVLDAAPRGTSHETAGLSH